jgi:hypothetical protein
MDKKLLDSLNNLSYALEALTEALASKKEAKSSVGSSLQSGDFIKQIQEINIGVKNISKDTQKILANQKTIMDIANSKGSGKKDAVSEIGDDKKKQNSFKEGLGVIMLLAVAIFALGLAFQVVGSVPIGTVLALSFAILVLAAAFAGVHIALKKVGFKPMDGLNFVIAITAISLGVAISSHILGMVKPISLAQFFTTVFIATGFVAIAYGMAKLLDAFKGKSAKQIALSAISLPIILPAISIGIAMSSWALQLVKPIGLAQFFTTLFIAAGFVIIAYGMAKLLDAFKGKDPKQIALAAISLPIILPAIALGIAMSSWALQTVMPISLAQFFTSLFIGGLFVLLSYGISQIVSAVNRMKWESVFKLPVLFTVMSVAIALSSHILNQVAPIGIGDLLRIMALGAILAGITLLLTPSIKILSKVNIKDILMGGIMIVAIAASIAISSHILALGNYTKFPDWNWVLGVGLSMIAFVPAMVLLGAIATSGGAVLLLAGALMVLVVAGTIAATSHILGLGKYDSYPSVIWSLGVVMAMAPFAIAMTALGAIALTGIGAVAFLAGIPMVLAVAKVITDVSHILGKGKYDVKGMLPWTLSTVLLFTTFTPMIVALGAMGIVGSVMKMFGADDPFVKAGSMLVSIADTIVLVSHRLVKGKYVGGPTKDWASGVSIAIGAFAPVYDMLLKSSVGKGGVTPKQFKDAILTVSDGIITAANVFGDNISVFDLSRVPKKEWGEGVGAALSAFAPVYEALMGKSFFKSSQKVIDEMRSGILMITDTIIEAGKRFAMVEGDIWNKQGPTKEWADGIGSAIISYTTSLSELKDKDIDMKDFGMVNSLITRMAISGLLINKYKKAFSTNIDPDFVKKMSPNIISYVDLAKSIQQKMGAGGLVSNLVGADPISQISKGMVKLAKSYDVLANSVKNFGNVLSQIDETKIDIFRSLTGNLAILSTLDQEMFNNMLDTLESRSGVFVDLLNKFQSQEQEKTNKSVGLVKQGSGTAPVKSSADITNEKLDQVIGLLSQINTAVSPLDDYLNELTIGKDNLNRSGSNNPSDIRLKKLINKIGVSDLGINIYSFMYINGDDNIYQGIMAQELIGTKFENAVILNDNGFYSVNYSIIDVEFKKIDKQSSIVSI